MSNAPPGAATATEADKLEARARELGIYSAGIADALSQKDLGALVKNVEAAIKSAALSVTDPDGGLVRALAAAQGAFPVIAKTKTATVTSTKGNYSYAYADLADVLEVVRPVLAAQELAITQQTLAREGKTILVTTLRHVAGGTIASEVELTPSPSNPQAFGGALTYLRRYELVTLLGVQADEDTDGQHVEAPAAAAPPAPELPAWARQASRDRLLKLGGFLEPMIGLDAARELVLAVGESLGVVPDVLVQFAGAIRARMPDDPARIPGPDDAADAALAEAAAAAAEAPDTTSIDEQPPPDAGIPDTDDAPPPGPPAASVTVEELPEHPAKAIGVLKAAGCICTDPLSDPHDDACPIVGHGIPF